MGSKKKKFKSIDDVLVDGFLEGRWPREMARELRITLTQAEKRLRACGLDPARYGRFDEEEVDTWVRLYRGQEDGFEWSINAIAVEYNLSWSTVAVQLACRLGKLRHRRLAARLAAARRAGVSRSRR
jgi:hypothetical protein